MNSSHQFKPNVSLIIAVYRRNDFLRLILRALELQTFRNFEVIVAEDCRDEETVVLLAEYCARGILPIKHVAQDDIGFRKNRIMNAAIKVARAEVLVFLDGDCIPHRNFVAAYANAVVPGFAYWGRRVMLGPRISARLNIGRMKLPITLRDLLLSDSRRIEEALPLRALGAQVKSRAISGCNWGICKRHLLAVNGFDEDYVSACVGEDVDVEERLILSGIKLKSMRNRAIVYHLHHRPNENADSHAANLQLMKDKIRRHGAICRNGLRSLT